MAELVKGWNYKQQANARMRIVDYCQEQLEMKGYKAVMKAEKEGQLHLTFWNPEMMVKVRDLKAILDNQEGLDPIVVQEANINMTNLKAELSALIIELLTPMKNDVVLTDSYNVMMYAGKRFIYFHSMNYLEDK